MSLDMLLLIMPMVEPDAPTAGAGVIKAHLLQEGYTAEVFDFNLHLFRELEKLGTHHKHYFTGEGAMKFSNSLGEELNDEYEQFYSDHKDIFNGLLDIIRDKNPKWVGCSLLSPFSAASAIKISRIIKEEFPDIKIVWGGTNIQHGGTFRYIHEGTIDAFIKGDGERSVIELLKGNWEYAGINKLDKIDEVSPLDLSLAPNYDDIDWKRYEHIFFSKPAYVSASRGCVRQCTFCNDFKIWPTYRFKSAKMVGEQIEELKSKYKRNTIHFTDSLLNGSPPVYEGILREMKRIKEQYAPSPFQWAAHLIFRSKEQAPEHIFQLMKESGCVDAVMGLESFSESVRWHMKKKFTNEDVWYTFEMLNKYNIRVQCLMLIGYATETEEDHQENLRGIDRIYELGYGNAKDPYTGVPLFRWTFGNSLLLNDKHDLYHILSEETPGWDHDYHSAMWWTYKDNDMATRLRRWKESIARVQLHDPTYHPTPTTQRTIEITEERLKNPNGPKFWAE